MKPRRWDTPRSSRAWRWRGVGVVIRVKAGRAAVGWMWLAAMVARSASRVAKLCAGAPSAVTLVVILARAAAERRAGATGLSRAGLAAAGSASLDSMGAGRGCMGQVT